MAALVLRYYRLLRSILRARPHLRRCLIAVTAKSEDRRLASGPFHAQAHLLTEGILNRWEGFLPAVRRLHDRGRPG